MVVKPARARPVCHGSLRVVLSHMVVKLKGKDYFTESGLRVVLSHMVVKRQRHRRRRPPTFESSVISYGSQTGESGVGKNMPFESSVISYGSQTHSLDWC